MHFLVGKDIEEVPITLDNQFHQGHGIELKKG